MSTPHADRSRPLWLLDFDGVINAVTRKPDRSVWPDWTFVEVFSPREGFAFPVWYSPTVIRFVADAHAAGVEITWLSTWTEEAAQFPRFIPGLPVLTSHSQPPRPTAGASDDEWWKYQVARTVAGDRPLVWTDDDLNAWAPGTRAAKAWATRRARTHVEVPADTIGLSPARLRRISNFFADYGITLPA